MLLHCSQIQGKLMRFTMNNQSPGAILLMRNKLNVNTKWYITWCRDGLNDSR